MAWLRLVLLVAIVLVTAMLQETDPRAISNSHHYSPENTRSEPPTKQSHGIEPNMTYTVLIFVYRKAVLTFAEFHDHYENTHVPLIKSLSGDLFPLVHRRHYPAQAADGAADDPFASLDCVTEAIWADEATSKRFFALRSQDGVKEKWLEDEEKFVDLSKVKTMIVGEVAETLAK